MANIREVHILQRREIALMVRESKIEKLKTIGACKVTKHAKNGERCYKRHKTPPLDSPFMKQERSKLQADSSCFLDKGGNDDSVNKHTHDTSNVFPIETRQAKSHRHTV